MFYKWQRVVLIDYMISWTVSWKLPTVIQPLINSPAKVGGANLCFRPCRSVVNLFQSSMSDFSPHGYEVIGSIAPDID